MKHSFNFFVLVTSVIFTMYSCKDTIELNEVDTNVTADLGLAMPIGTISASIGDFLGIKEIKPYVLVDEDGVIHLVHDTILARNYRRMDITQYPADTLKKCYVKSGFGVPEIWPGDEFIVEYPVDITFDNLNDNPSEERMDSISIKHANYTCNVKITPDLAAQGFKWDWITRIDVVLKDAFSRKAGETITVYDKNKNAVSDFGQNIQIDLDNFRLCMMKDRTQKPGPTNVVTSAKLGIKYYVSVPWSANKITLTDESCIDYNLNLQMLEFDALWGYAKPSKDMRDDNHMVIAELWPMWKDIKRATLPLAEPSVDLTVYTQVAGKFQLNGDYFYVVCDENPTDTTWAQFTHNGTISKSNIYLWINEGDYLPITPNTIGQTHRFPPVRFDKKPENGAIDRLFKVRPDRLTYKFSVDVYDPANNQIRLAQNNNFDVNTHIDIPLVFDEGLGIQYADTIKNIDLSEYTLEKLLNGAVKEEDLEKANVVLYVSIKNRLPLGISAYFQFQDENGNLLYKKDGTPLQLLKLGTNPDTLFVDTLNLSLPKVEKMKRTEATPVFVAKDEQEPEQYIIDIDKENFDLLTKVKQIVFNATIHNDGPKLDEYPVAILDKSSLSVKLGVTARINGKIDLRALLEEKKNDK